MKEIKKTVVLATSERMYSDEIDAEWTLVGEYKVGDTFESDGLEWTVTDVLWLITE